MTGVESLTCGSLFAGVGGFDLGIEAAGFAVRWQVEWDEKCQQVLRYHWPEVDRRSDVCTVDGATLEPVDLITFGSPCQDLSVAGRRAGLAGERSGLFHEAVRIIREMRDATDTRFPRWAIWENVAGSLSSNDGHDFAAVLDSLADAGAVAIEWAVLDAQYFGVPQRRRRVFVIACFDPATADRCPDPLLPVASSLPRDIATRREARHRDTGIVADFVIGDGESTEPVLGNASLFTAVAFGHKQGIDIQASEVASPTLRANGDGAAVAIHEGQRGELRLLDAAPALNGTGGKPGQGYAAVLAFGHTQGIDIQASQHASPTLRTEGGGAAIATTGTVRRLTPLECERLMGWPDEHTRYGRHDDGTIVEIADSPRYRMIGNGVASPVAAWIGRHIAAVDNA